MIKTTSVLNENRRTRHDFLIPGTSTSTDDKNASTVLSSRCQVSTRSVVRLQATSAGVSRCLQYKT